MTFDQLKWRELIALLGTGAVAWLLVARAQLLPQKVSTSGLVVLLTGALLGSAIPAARSQSQPPDSSPAPAAVPTPAEKLTDKLYPKWKLSDVPDLSQPIFLKKGSRVCRADSPLMISAIVGGDPHFLFQNKECEAVDAEIGVQVIDRCAGEQAPCNALFRFQEKFAVVFITWDGAPKTIAIDLLQMRPLLAIGTPMSWVAKSSLQNRK
jgi:hypothetical protein